MNNTTDHADIQPGVTVLTDKGRFTHTARTSTETVCGKTILRIFNPERPFWSPSCKSCERRNRF